MGKQSYLESLMQLSANILVTQAAPFSKTKVQEETDKLYSKALDAFYQWLKTQKDYSAEKIEIPSNRIACENVFMSISKELPETIKKSSEFKAAQGIFSESNLFSLFTSLKKNGSLNTKMIKTQLSQANFLQKAFDAQMAAVTESILQEPSARKTPAAAR